MKFLDLTNKRFNRLLVLERTKNKGKKTAWKCLCDCGNIVYVETTNLTSNRTKSCGCLKMEKLIQRSTTHNQRHTKLYEVWKTMKQRCFNPNNQSFHRYGGRGISVCEEWKNSFSSFYEWSIKNEYKEGFSIDRIDNNGDYCPKNCRWADKLTQANNTRTNKYISFQGEVKTLAQWSRILNIPYKKLQSQLQNKTLEEIIKNS